MNTKPNGVDSRGPRSRRATLLLSTIAAALAACQSVEPAKAGADWRIEPLMRVTNSTETAVAYYALGRYFQGQNRTQPALDAFRRALAIDPRYAEAHNAVGALLGAQGKLEEAIRAFEAALAITPAAPHILSNLGYTLALSGRHVEALGFLRRAVQLDPTNSKTQLNLALVVRAAESRAAAEQVAAEQAAAEHDAAGPDSVLLATNELNSVPPATNESDSVQPATKESDSVQPAVMDSDSVRPETAQADVAAQAVPVELAPVQPVPVPLAAIPSAAVQPAATPPAATPRDTGEGSRIANPAPTKEPNQARPVVYRLEVANGNGINGAAARVAALFARSGAPAARLRNVRPFAQKATVIYFAAGFEGEAQRLAGSFGDLAVAVQPGAPISADVRVVLGRDLVPALAEIFRPSAKAGGFLTASPRKS
ncbi:MAG TPA: tetratricopeptide repeat protein [Burkholderiaceae bacterium]|nr:tetratricopeptide repeat protein [Burkholderiaceae bacterium]